MKRNFGYFKKSVIEFIVAAIILLLSILFFSIIADEIVIEKENSFDTTVFRYISSFTSPSTTQAALFVTNFGSGYFLIPAYLFIILYHVKIKKTKEATIVGIIAIISLLSGWLLKVLFHRFRPSLPLISGVGGFSFPSGHSLAAFTFSGVLIYLLWRTSLKPFLKSLLSILLIIFSILIGTSRIYLRVHFASDVLASLLLTVVWLSLTFILLETVEKKSIQVKRMN